MRIGPYTKVLPLVTLYIMVLLQMSLRYTVCFGVRVGFIVKDGVNSVTTNVH